MKHLFFFFHTLAFLAGFTCLGFSIFVYKLKKDIRIKYYSLIVAAYMLILLEQTVTSYSLVNSISNPEVSFFTDLISAVGCGLIVYYLPAFALSFSNSAPAKSIKIFNKCLTCIFLAAVILYYIQPFKLYMDIVGNSILIISIIYSLVILISHARSASDSSGSRIIRKFFILTLIFLPYMALDMKIEKLPGIGRYFPYGIFSVPMFLLALSSLTLYYGYKEFKGVFQISKSEDKTYTDEEAAEDNKKDNEKFYSTFNITKREKEIIDLLVKGYSYNRISSELVVALPTVKSHVYNIYQKTGVKSKIELLNLMNTMK